MRLQPVIDQLATAGFARVDQVLALADLATQPNLSQSSAYVIPDAESATPAAFGTGIFEQLVTVGFSVVVVVPASIQRDRAGDELDALERAVKSLLIAWPHPDAAQGHETEYAGATLIGLGGGRVSRQLRFRTAQRERVVRGA